MSYQMNARCTNCGHMWKASIPKGTSAGKWETTSVCPKCGVTGTADTSIPI